MYNQKKKKMHPCTLFSQAQKENGVSTIETLLALFASGNRLAPRFLSKPVLTIPLLFSRDLYHMCVPPKDSLLSFDNKHKFNLNKRGKLPLVSQEKISSTDSLGFDFLNA